MASRIKIDFKKLQSFKGKQRDHLSACHSSTLLKNINLGCLLNVTDVDPTKWQILYLAKLKACHKIADFSDAKKDVELKEAKKECLIEIIDVLDEPEAADYIIKERVLEAAMEMISANLFRTFANKSRCLKLYHVHVLNLNQSACL